MACTYDTYFVLIYNLIIYGRNAKKIQECEREVKKLYISGRMQGGRDTKPSPKKMLYMDHALRGIMLS